MNDKRPISFSTKFAVLKGDKPFFILGAIFTGVSIFILVPLLITVIISAKEPYEKYDFKAIEKYGVETTANITDIETIYNTTINGEHPKVISYSYYNNGQPYFDKFKTLTAYNDAPLKAKDEIKIKAYNNQSVIEGIKPFSFPYYIFFVIPLIFLLVGVPFLAVAIVPAINKLNLYKFGTVKEATIAAMRPIVAYVKNRYDPYVLVDYWYSDIIGQKMVGKSTTHDMAILTTKKIGDKIKVFVSEEDERKSCLVPMEEVKKNGWTV